MKGVTVRIIAGIILFLVGCALTVYVAGYLCFYMGIANILDGLNAEPDGNTDLVVLGIARFLATGFVARIVWWIAFELGNSISEEPRKPPGGTTNRQGEVRWEQMMRDAEDRDS
ncbi:MAG TPA: hypothetical protein VK694_08015 [Verrucomicrobiae bacterium]|nr:hypothetical protein [Verrucomicrobiae bacterium]